VALIKPGYPYLITGYDYSFRCDLVRNVWTAQTFPEVQKVAFTQPNDSLGERMRAFCTAGWKSMGVDIVYSELFAYETTDFAPIVTAMLENDPDVLDLGSTYPGWSDLLVEQAFLQGFEGKIVTNAIDLELVLAKVPGEWLNMRFFDSYPEFDDPYWGDPSPQLDFYNEWEAIYGPGAPQDQFRIQSPIDWLYAVSLEVWIAGVEAAGTFDAQSVVNGTKSLGEIETLQGLVYFPEAAEEVFGINNLYQAQMVQCTINDDGKRVIVGEVNFWDDWYPQYKEFLFEELDALGTTWSER
jgi:branched-chain amino acid transport system substrate-binding protein